MCGRYVPPNVADLERLWNLKSHGFPVSSDIRYNVAPTSGVPMIRAGANGDMALDLARWGLVPFWWKQSQLPNLTFNARSEEAATKPMWRSSLKSQRCVMPAVGWYEWCETQKVPGPSGRPTNQPYYHYAPGSQILAIAGLWSEWSPSGLDPILSCALMTKEAAATVKPVHHRMPVILREEHMADWLNPATPADAVRAIIDDARTEFTFHPVSVRVNNARNDGADLVNPIGAAGQLLAV